MSPPRWLAWSGGIAAAVTLTTSLLLWGTQGPALLLDAVVAYCF
jgi:uncharacterized membrane protein YdcZ (DUF606 family)